MFLDTNILIMILSQSPALGILKFCDSYFVKRNAFISDIVFVEFLSWNKITNETAETISKSILKLCKPKRYTRNVLIKAAEIRRYKKSLKLPDAIIAATAICYKLPLLTFNVVDFKGILDLNLIDANNIS